MKEKIKKFEHLLDKSKKILLLTHQKMDGDAIGSSCCFYEILEKLKKDVYLTNDGIPPENFSFLGINKLFKENLDLEKINPDLIICFDTASADQLGEIYSENTDFFKGREMVVIDHHISNTKFGTLNLVDAEYSSTCELIFHIIKKLGFGKYLTKKCLNLLLTGVITDTNVFFNKNTTRDTLEKAGKLLEMGGDLHEIIYKFYHETSFEKLKLKSIVFDKLEKNKDGKIVYSTISKENFKDTKTIEEDTTGIVSDLINIKGCEVAFLAYEYKDKVKVSFRAKTFDIGGFATKFGGGGHKLASGLFSEKNLKEVVKEILKSLEKEI